MTEISEGFQTRFRAEEHHLNAVLRLKKVADLIKKIFTDFYNFFSVDTINEIKSIFTGKAIIKKEQTSILKIHTAPFIKTSFQNPYKDSEKNAFDLEKAKSIITHELFLHLAYHVQNISYDRLFEGLNGCIEKFKALVENRPYQVGILEGKSQGWLAKMAKSYFGLKYASTFGLFCDSVNHIQATSITDSSTDLVFFDDISYSGNQVFEITQYLIQNQAYHAFKSKPVNLYVIIPFMTEHAKRRLEHLKERAGQHVTLHLITTDHHIPVAEEIVPNAGSLGGVESHNALCLPEWKMPDGLSFPVCFRDLCKEKIIPPYKKEG